MSSDLAKRLNAHSSTVPKGQLRDDLRTAADELERLSTPTDVADRREAIARIICKAMGDDPDRLTYVVTEPGVMEPYGEAWTRYLPAVDCLASASLIAGPLPKGFAEAREAWEGVLAGMKRFGMESEAIETIDDYFASSKPTVRDRWQHVAYFDEGAFHWMSGIAPRDCELFARPTGES